MRILLVHNDEHALLTARRALRPSHLIWHVTMVTSAASARAELARRAYDVVVADEDVQDEQQHTQTDAPPAPRIPLNGASDLADRIAALDDRQRATSVNPSSLYEAFTRLVITHAVASNA